LHKKKRAGKRPLFPKVRDRVDQNDMARPKDQLS
jgi:hypothetical protein